MNIKSVFSLFLILLLTACSGAADRDDLESAQRTLENYFFSLANGDYGTAVDLMADNPEFWLAARQNNPEVNPNDPAALMAAACQYQYMCLPLREVISAQQLSPDEYRFVVRFSAPDGELFVLGPCCGADETEMPPVSEFSYSVIRSDGQFRAAAEPIYVP